jgi:hypothetical protein
MNGHADATLLEFAADVLEKHGGAVERHERHIESLLPPALSAELDVPEETAIGDADIPLMYGSPILDRIISLATRDVPVVYGHVSVPYLKRDGFDQVLKQDIELLGPKVKVVGRAETRSVYMILVCKYVALSDERKEGLIKTAVNESTGVIVDHFTEAADTFEVEYYDAGLLPGHFEQVPDRALRAGLRHAEDRTERELAGFLESMRRRLQREVRNTREYYEALADEMRESLSHANLSAALYEERSAKLAELPHEMDAKIQDLTQKFSVHVTIQARAAFRLLVPVVQVMAQIHYRKLRKPLNLTWNPVSRRIDPLPCGACGHAERRLYARQEGESLQWRCVRCKDG